MRQRKFLSEGALLKPSTEKQKILLPKFSANTCLSDFRSFYAAEKRLPSKQGVQYSANPFDDLIEVEWEADNLTLAPAPPYFNNAYYLKPENKANPVLRAISRQESLQYNASHYPSDCVEYIFENPVESDIFITQLLKEIQKTKETNWIFSICLDTWTEVDLAYFLARLERLLNIYALTPCENIFSYHAMFSFQFFGNANKDQLAKIEETLSSFRHTTYMDFNRVTMESPKDEKYKEKLEKKIRTTLRKNIRARELAIHAQHLHRVAVLEASLPSLTEWFDCIPLLGSKVDTDNLYWKPEADPKRIETERLIDSCRQYSYFYEALDNWYLNRKIFSDSTGQILNTENHAVYCLLNKIHDYFEKIDDTYSMSHPPFEFIVSNEFAKLEKLTLIERRNFSEAENYYAVLNLPSNPAIPQKMITRAYRLLSLKFHSDKNQSPDAPQHFDLIQKAYKHLSNRTAQNATTANEREYQNRLQEKQKQRQAIMDEIRALAEEVHSPSNSPESQRSCTNTSNVSPDSLLDIDIFLNFIENGLLKPISVEENNLSTKKSAKKKSKHQQLQEFKIKIENQLLESKKIASQISSDKKSTQSTIRKFYLEEGEKFQKILNDFSEENRKNIPHNFLSRFAKYLKIALKGFLGLALAVPTLSIPLYFKGYRDTFFSQEKMDSSEALGQKLGGSLENVMNIQEQRARNFLKNSIAKTTQFQGKQRFSFDDWLNETKVRPPQSTQDWLNLRNNLLIKTCQKTASFGWLGAHAMPHHEQEHLQIFYSQWLKVLLLEAQEKLTEGQTVEEALLNMPYLDQVFQELITLQESFDLAGKSAFGQWLQDLHIHFAKLAKEHQSKKWLHLLWGGVADNHFPSLVDPIFVEYETLLSRQYTQYQSLLQKAKETDLSPSATLPNLFPQLAWYLDAQCHLLRQGLVTLIPNDIKSLQDVRLRLEKNVEKMSGLISDISKELPVFSKNKPSDSPVGLPPNFSAKNALFSSEFASQPFLINIPFERQPFAMQLGLNIEAPLTQEAFFHWYQEKIKIHQQEPQLIERIKGLYEDTLIYSLPKTNASNTPSIAQTGLSLMVQTESTALLASSTL